MATTPDKSPDRIAGMFDAIAPRYDLLNHLLSGGIDRRWRSAAIKSLNLSGRETLLDVCCGTGDVGLEARRTPGAQAARVVGVDFSPGMLALGLRKIRTAGEPERITLIRADAMHLPVADSSVDAVTIAFGIRNVQQPQAACAEIARALRPGGRVAILEFGVPRVPGIKPLYLWYFNHVLPRIGRAISGHNAAYSYLAASVGTFAPPADFVQTLRGTGFASVRADPLTFGIVYLYAGVRG